jgi:hypothetical protein
MKTAQEDIEIRETAGLKSCNSCSRELREGDKFCRRCGANQIRGTASESPEAMDATDDDSKYRTSRLLDANDCYRFSGSLMKSLVGNVSVRRSRINNRFAKRVVSLLAAPALWLMIVLLAPFDAYVAARSIGGED